MSSLVNVVHEPIDLILDANESWREPFFARLKRPNTHLPDWTPSLTPQSCLQERGNQTGVKGLTQEETVKDNPDRSIVRS